MSLSTGVNTATTTTTTNTTTTTTMLSLREHIAAESARWAASRAAKAQDEQSVGSSATTSTADSVFSSSRLHSKFRTHTLSRRSSTSSLATEFEPEPAQQFVAPRDFNGTPITVYASLEAAVAAQGGAWSFEGQGEEGGGGVGAAGGGAAAAAEQPRRLVTPGKLYENEEDDDEIIYELQNGSERAYERS
ncbi:hypothetical protein SAMD00023353_0403320 [Rosellinia necatrix]|uniref:Uncharacterized protein n=1 Tax=Rosellinia necatrix TaxID=77044 RepID=A0A1S8A6I6_ROSNE|nr:hypothetical protein SAMD00023353_0403320 [Rosellinia necatrix]